MSDVLIIGAGPAGLTSAYELSKLNKQATILEADNQVGGISRTVNYQEFRFDIGGHRFFTKIPYVQKLWEEILGEEFLLRPRLSRIYYHNHFFDYPLKIKNALTNLGPTESFLVGMSYLKTKFRTQSREQNFEEWVSNRFGDRLYRMFFKTYTEKVWGIPCREISADWAAQRIKNLSLTEALRNAILNNSRSKNGEIITTLIDRFHYPRLGPGLMWERCEQRLAAKGSQTLLNIRAEKIRHRNDRVECIYGKSQNGEKTEFDAQQFISTMPIRELIYMLDPAPPDEILRAASQLRYRDYLTVVLVVNRESVFPDNWIYIHSPEVKMGRIQNYKNWSPEMVPDSSKTSLGLEYFLWDKDEEWFWPDQRLLELGIRECAQIGIISPNEVEDGTVVRMKKAYPVYDQNYQRALDKIRAYLENFENFQTIGRNGLHRYNNQDHSMLTGVYAARNIAGENLDVWSVNTEEEYHEESSDSQEQRLIPTRLRPEEQLAEEVLKAAFAPLDSLALGVSVGLVSSVLLFLATAWLLIKGGDVIGPNLSLLNQFLLGYKVSWPGALIGFFEAGVLGFAFGALFAKLRNFGIKVYAWTLKRQSEAESWRDLLFKI